MQASQFRQLIRIGWICDARMSDCDPASAVEIFLRLFIAAFVFEIGDFVRERSVAFQCRIIRRNPSSYLRPFKVAEFQLDDFIMDSMA